MTASTNKKVLIARFDRETVAGFVNPQSYLQAGGVELVTRASVHAVIPYSEIKAVYFVRDFEGAEISGERRLFATRPRIEGLWVRMTFRDGEVMDGSLPNNLLEVEPCGFTVTPADPATRGQRIFVPRLALRAMEVLGVVGSPLRRRKPKPEVEEQIKLFE